MATSKKTPISVEALKHDEATRKNIPTAEYQAVLAKAGFTRVHNLDGGIQAWEQANMPVSRKKK